MPDREKVKKGFERCLSGKMPFGCGECPYFGDEEYNDAWSCRLSLMRDSFDLLKEQEAKPLCCKECSYHRNDGWCNEHGREVKESDYCSFGAWEGR